MVQLSHPHMNTGKIIVLARWTFVGKVMSLLSNMLLRVRHDLVTEQPLYTHGYFFSFPLDGTEGTEPIPLECQA